MVTVYVCQAGRNLLIAQSRLSSVTYHVLPAQEPCRTNVLPVTTDLSLAEASVSLVTKPVRPAQPDQVLINAIPASKANLHLHQALVNAAISHAESAAVPAKDNVPHVMTTQLSSTDTVNATTELVVHSNSPVLPTVHSDMNQVQQDVSPTQLSTIAS